MAFEEPSALGPEGGPPPGPPGGMPMGGPGGLAAEGGPPEGAMPGLEGIPPELVQKIMMLLKSLPPELLAQLLQGTDLPFPPPGVEQGQAPDIEALMTGGEGPGPLMGATPRGPAAESLQTKMGG
jgi:hypothetical protein